MMLPASSAVKSNFQLNHTLSFTKITKKNVGVDCLASEVGELLGGTKIMRAGEDYFITPQSGKEIFERASEYSGLNIKPVANGFVIYEDNHNSWYFQFTDEISGSALPVQKIRPNAIFAELYGFRGVRTIRNIPMPRHPQYGSAFYKGELGEYEPYLQSDMTLEELKQAREYLDRTLLMYAGHIGISLNGGNEIYGWLPKVDKGVSEDEIAERLFKYHDTYPGELNNDRWIFELAQDMSDRLHTNTGVIVSLVRISSKTAQTIQQKIDQLHRGDHNKRYGFPHPTHDPNMVSNCATCPGRNLNAPIPEPTGQLNQYIPNLQLWAKMGTVDMRNYYH